MAISSYPVLEVEALSCYLVAVDFQGRAGLDMVVVDPCLLTLPFLSLSLQF